MRREYLKIENGIKNSGGYDVLCGLNIQLFCDEVNGIISSDQKEIDCLLNILSGEESFNYGHIYFDGKLINAYGEMKELESRVVVINRTSRLVENLTLAENIYVVRRKNNTVFVHQEEVECQLRLLIESFQINIEIDKLVKTLSELERYKMELIKAYIIGYEMVLMDMRLNDLSIGEIEELVELTKKLKVRHMTLVVIDNVIPQIMQYVDTLTIVNYGKTVRILDKIQFNEKLIYQLLMDRYGGINVIEYEPKYEPQNDEMVLELTDVTSQNIRSVNIGVKCGEIITIVCEKAIELKNLLEILEGENTQWNGTIMLDGKCYNPNGIEEAIHLGVGFIENNPLEEDLFKNLNVFDNICMIKGSGLKGLWWKKRYRKSIQNRINKCFGRDVCSVRIDELTGIEMQKVLYYRWNLYNPSLMVIVKPFSTGDIHMCAAATELILEFSKKKIAVLILTQNELTLGRIVGRKLLLSENGLVEYSV